MTIERVKHKLEFHTGTSTMSNQVYYLQHDLCLITQKKVFMTNCWQLFLLDDAGKIISECEDGRKLGYYSPYDGCRLHIVDNDPNSVCSSQRMSTNSPFEPI